MGRQYGTTALAHLCQNLEGAAKDDNLEKVSKLLEEIKRETERVDKAFQEYDWMVSDA